MAGKENKAVRGSLWMQVHRWLGLFAMIFLGLAAITGCLLTLDRPIDEALNADLFKRSEAAARPADPVAAAEAFARSHPQLRVLGVPLTVRADRNIPITVGAAPGAPEPEYDQIFLDRADGHVVGARMFAPSWGRRGFVAGLAEFHYDLLAGDVGRWFMGLVALAWLVSNFVGFYLTLPERRPFWKNWRRMWVFRRDSSLPRLLLDLHRASGLWLLIGITALAFTSVALNFYDEAYEPTAVAISPLKRSLFDQPAPFPQGTETPKLAYADALRLARAQAARSGLEWKPATALYLPDWNFYGVTFTDNGVLNYHALGPVYYYFDAATGRFAHEVNPYTDSAGLIMIRILYPLHSGKVGGTITIIIVFLLGAATVEMCVTGGYVWWKKRRSRVAARVAKRRRPGVAAAP